MGKNLILSIFLFIDSLNSRRIFVADINHLSWGFNQIRGGADVTVLITER